MKYILLIIGVAIILFFIARKLFLTLLFTIIQYYAWAIFDKLKLNIFITPIEIPLIHLDKELSNIVIILITHYYGILYGLLVIITTLIIHFLHVEVRSFLTLLDYIVKGLLLIAIISLFSSASLFILIPVAITIIKIFGIIYQKMLGFSLLNPFNMTEIFTILAYFGVFNFIRVFLNILI